MREAGFHGFSFREIAQDVGVKSSSVHHHFPTKEDLAVAVARAYTERQLAGLGDPNDPKQDPGSLLGRFVDSFRRDLTIDQMMCLCGLLASETSGLGDNLNAEVRNFFDSNLRWLEVVLSRAAPGARPQEVSDKALMIVATLEGALLIGHSYGDRDAFERTVESLAESIALSNDG